MPASRRARRVESPATARRSPALALLLARARAPAPRFRRRRGAPAHRIDELRITQLQRADRGPPHRARAAVKGQGLADLVQPDAGAARPISRSCAARSRSSPTSSSRRKSASATCTSISTRGCARSSRRRRRRKRPTCKPRRCRRRRSARRARASSGVAAAGRRSVRRRRSRRRRPREIRRKASPSSARTTRALDQFKRGDYAGAIAGFNGFLKAYPRSPLASSAQYWVGNAQYARRDYRGSIADAAPVAEGVSPTAARRPTHCSTSHPRRPTWATTRRLAERSKS